MGSVLCWGRLGLSVERRTYRCLRIHSNSTLFFPRMTFSQPQQGTTKLEVWLLKIHLSYDLEIMACTDNTFSTLKTGGTKNKYHHYSSEHSYCVNTFIRHTFSKQLTATSNSSDLQVYNSKRFHKVLCFSVEGSEKFLNITVEFRRQKGVQIVSSWPLTLGSNVKSLLCRPLPFSAKRSLIQEVVFPHSK